MPISNGESLLIAEKAMLGCLRADDLRLFTAGVYIHNVSIDYSIV
jgi:hypothetical protein